MAKKANQLKSEINNTETTTAPEKPQKKKSNGIFTRTKDRINSILENEKLQKVTGLFFIALSFFLATAFTSYLFNWEVDLDKLTLPWKQFLFNSDAIVSNKLGKIGAIIAHVCIYQGFGIASFFIVVTSFLVGVKILFKTEFISLSKFLPFAFFGLVWLSVALGYIFINNHLLILGGAVGYQATRFLSGDPINPEDQGMIGYTGTGLLLFVSALVFLVIAINLSFNWLPKKKEEKDEIKPIIEDKKEDDTITIIGNKLKDEEENSFTITNNKKEEPTKADNLELSVENEKEIEIPGLTIEKQKEEIITNNESADEARAYSIEALGEYDPTLDLSKYKYPTLDLLNEYGHNEINVNREELEANKNKIVETLGNYSIEISKIKATIGPTVTLYEIIPAPGVRISKIKSLEDDIALSLSALGIRIIAPIPGKGTIGIEVPNQQGETVSMKSVLMSEKFQKSKMDLPIALGRTIANETYVVDLAKMPHLLMAGATGQGKSVGLNAILASLLYKKHPAELKFVLVDPKKVELTLFNKIERHFLAKLPGTEEPIITDTKSVIHTLNSLCTEMDLRYELLKHALVRNIKEYNTKFVARRLNPNDGHRYMPYIVLVIDEFADLIMTAGKEIETPIARLAQLARAIGIHLIIATQRPSVNIITGTIKANFPCRIAFRVASKIDSRTILDTGGADQLIGKGDMLLSNGSDVIRIQCAFLDTPEVDKLTDFIGSQRGYSSAFLLPEFTDETAKLESSEGDPSERDPMFKEAALLIISHQQGSTSLIQRKLKLGYNRA